jgi:hypothetical protein
LKILKPRRQLEDVACTPEVEVAHAVETARAKSLSKLGLLLEKAVSQSPTISKQLTMEN